MTSNNPSSQGSDLAVLIGTVLAGRYRLTRDLGSGATTAIFDAIDEETGDEVTFKLIRPRLAAVNEFRDRFDEAMRGAADLRHPNIAVVYDFGYTPVATTESAFVVTERLTGGSLRDLFDRGRRLTPSQALVVGLDACRALDVAHRRNQVHGELVPSKIVFGDDRRLRIVDFGLSRLIGRLMWVDPSNVPNHVAGYASPEQATGQRVGGKSDVYSLALTLTEAITGALPFKADSTTPTLAARVGRLLPVTADMGPLASVLEHAARPDVEDRSSAAEFGKNLVQVATRLPRPEPLPLLSASPAAQGADGGRRAGTPAGGVIVDRDDRSVPSDPRSISRPSIRPDDDTSNDAGDGGSFRDPGLEVGGGRERLDSDLDSDHEFELVLDDDDDLEIGELEIGADQGAETGDGEPSGDFEAIDLTGIDMDVDEPPVEVIDEGATGVIAAITDDRPLSSLDDDDDDLDDDDGDDLDDDDLDDDDLDDDLDDDDDHDDDDDDDDLADDSDEPDDEPVGVDEGATGVIAVVESPLGASASDQDPEQLLISMSGSDIDDYLGIEPDDDDIADAFEDGGVRETDDDAEDAADDDAEDAADDDAEDAADDDDDDDFGGHDFADDELDVEDDDEAGDDFYELGDIDDGADDDDDVVDDGSDDFVLVESVETITTAVDSDVTGVVPVTRVDRIEVLTDEFETGVVPVINLDSNDTGVVPVIALDSNETGVVPIVSMDSDVSSSGDGGSADTGFVPVVDSAGPPPADLESTRHGHDDPVSRDRRSIPWKTIIGGLVVLGLVVLALVAFKLLSTPKYVVPDLTGRPLAEAQSLIAPNGWDVRVTTERSDEQPTPDNVIRTNPAAGAEVAEGEPFEIVASQGPLQRELPDLTGLDGNDAQARLQQLGMVVTTERANDENVAKGKVIRWYVPGDESIGVGSYVDPGTKIILVVSDGPAPRAVPNLVGMSLADAQTAIDEIGLSLKVTGRQPDASVPADTVMSQSVPEGKQVERGAEVGVVVSEAPTEAAFPDLTGVTGYEAMKAAVEAAGFAVNLQLGDGTGADVSYTIDGVVPEPGQTFPLGTVVDFETI